MKNVDEGGEAHTPHEKSGSFLQPPHSHGSMRLLATSEPPTAAGSLIVLPGEPGSTTTGDLQILPHYDPDQPLLEQFKRDAEAGGVSVAIPEEDFEAYLKSLESASFSKEARGTPGIPFNSERLPKIAGPEFLDLGSGRHGQLPVGFKGDDADAPEGGMANAISSCRLPTVLEGPVPVPVKSPVSARRRIRFKDEEMRPHHPMWAFFKVLIGVLIVLAVLLALLQLYVRTM